MLNKKKIITFLKLVVSLLIIYFLIKKYNIDFKNVFFKIINYKFLFLALLFPFVINPLISVNRWKYFLKVQGINENFFSLTKLHFISLFYGLFLPSSIGGDTIRIYELEKKHTQNKGAAASAIFIERFIGFIILSLICFIGGLFSFYFFKLNITYSIVGFLLFIFLISLLFLLKNKKAGIFISNQISKLTRFSKVQYFISEFYVKLKIFPLRKVLLPSLPLFIGLQLASILCCFLIFKSYDMQLNFWIHICLIPIIQIISIIPVSISGIGVRESSFVLFYAPFFQNTSDLFFVSLMFYFVSIVFPAIFGGVLSISSFFLNKPLNIQ